MVRNSLHLTQNVLFHASTVFINCHQLHSLNLLYLCLDDQVCGKCTRPIIVKGAFVCITGYQLQLHLPVPMMCYKINIFLIYRY